ncbi:hypothetical protein [Sediminimonas qiaohouensis]|uniref:hypothetical protein n=1 Tax=Sediminimonas qiaohouensis TaxID=552061 RepID=UPI00047DCD6C|nr:hypothetical protein [Sediminimonas qiaohouensis]
MRFLRFRLDDPAFDATLVWCCRGTLAHAAKVGTPFALFEGHLVRKSHNFHGEQTMDSSFSIHPISRSSKRDFNLTVLSTEAREEVVEAGDPRPSASLTLVKDSARETK